MMSIQDVILFFCVIGNYFVMFLLHKSMYVEETLAFGSIHTYVFVN